MHFTISCERTPCSRMSINQRAPDTTHASQPRTNRTRVDPIQLCSHLKHSALPKIQEITTGAVDKSLTSKHAPCCAHQAPQPRLWRKDLTQTLRCQQIPAM